MSFFHRHKVKDKKALHQALVVRGYDPPHHEDDQFDSFLGTIMTAELISDMSDHFVPPAIDTSPAIDTGPSLDPGGGASGGGGADGAW